VMPPTNFRSAQTKNRPAIGFMYAKNRLVVPPCLPLVLMLAIRTVKALRTNGTSRSPMTPPACIVGVW
jgi:hypothetical protein